MGFVNALLRTVGCSTFRVVIKEGVNRQILRTSHQLLQCRLVMVTHCMNDQEKPSASEKVDLDAWKNVLRSAAPKTECEQETQEESTIESMQKLVDMWRKSGKSVPDCISTEELQSLLKLTTKTSRRRYLKVLKLKELRKASGQRKKLEKLQQKSNIEITTEKGDVYMLKFWRRSEDYAQAWRCAQAMIFGQPLVFDMAYARYMPKRDMENTISQLKMSTYFNQKAMEPFHIHFCNLQPDGPYHETILKQYRATWDESLITVTEKSHVDIFPKDQLVYLTADSPNVLKTFDHNKVYIIGAFVDRSQQTGVSLGNAKQLQVATARLPLDHFLRWKSGAKNLTLNNMIEILMTIKDTGDWNKALSYVPRRKVDVSNTESESSEHILLSNPKLFRLLKKKATEDQKATKGNKFCTTGA